MSSAAQLDSTFALSVLQKLDHYFTITNFFFLVILQGVADSKSIFIFIYIGALGKQNDGGTFFGSTLYHFLENLESTVPKPGSFEGSGTEMSFVIPVDEACPLKTFLMKPFARKDLSCEECVFNCRLWRARRCVECAFGILAAKWRLLNKAIETNINKAERIVRCVCLLHNIIIDTGGTTHDPSVFHETSQIHVSRQAKKSVKRQIIQYVLKRINRRKKCFQSTLLRTYCIYIITEPAGLFALSVQCSTTLWNICLCIKYMTSRYS